MLVIICPYCGPRNSSEFTYHGEMATRPRVDDTDPGSWRHYLYDKHNVAGWQQEGWFHSSGCRRHLIAERNTITNEVRRVSDVADSQ